MVWVFANGPGDRSLISGRGRVIPKTKKRFLWPPYLTLSIIKYGSRVSGSSHGKLPPLHLSVVGIENIALGHPQLQSANLYIYIYIYIYWERERERERECMCAFKNVNISLWVPLWYHFKVSTCTSSPSKYCYFLQVVFVKLVLFL